MSDDTIKTYTGTDIGVSQSLVTLEQFLGDVDSAELADEDSTFDLGPPTIAINALTWTIEQREARVAELEGALRPIMWQPIETAPRDGSNCLLATEKRACEGYYNGENDRWYLANTHWTDYHDSSVEPTHWMPLPDLPSQRNRLEVMPNQTAIQTGLDETRPRPAQSPAGADEHRRRPRPVFSRE